MPRASRKQIENLVIIAIVVVGGLIRSVAYGDLRMSVGNIETGSYIAASRARVFAWKAFAGKRLFTTNLIYKLANDPRQCPLLALSDPATGHGARPVIQSCFSTIALLQNVMAILAWCFLAWTTARWMQTFPARVGAAVVILLFGFTPQVAEWESVLSPESLSVSGVVILLALLQEMVLGLAYARYKLDDRRLRVFIGVWLFIFALWLFLRDVHLYALPITLVMLALLLLASDLRRRMTIGIVLGTLLLLFVLGYVSAQASHRATRYPLAHSFEDYILPFPARVEFFKGFGMPDPTARGYQYWLDNNATRTYAAFLITHPGFVLSTLADNLEYFKGEFVQQYFEPPAPNNRFLLIQLGEVIHPETLAIFLIDVLFIVGLWLAARKGASLPARGWAWMASWFFLSSATMLFVGFFGDAEGARRHIYPAVEAFRLLFWLLLFVYFDQVLANLPSGRQSPTPSEIGAPNGI